MKEILLSVEDAQAEFQYGGEENYEYYNEETGEWEELTTCKYLEKVHEGFPVPEKASQQITLIQIYDNKEEVMIVLGQREWKHQHKYTFEYPVKYIHCKDEIDLLEKYLQIFNKLDPLMIYAWNGSNFDFPYIYNRLKRLNFDTNRMSNYGETSLEEKMFMGRKEFNFKCDGHFYVDMLDVYKKFIFTPRASYALDYISEAELGDRKVAHNEYSSFDDFYTGKYNIPSNPTEYQINSDIYQEAIKGNWDEVKELSHSEFVYYGIVDTYLIKRLDDKLNFTVLMNMISEKMGVQISDSLGTVKPWSQFILNKSMLDNKVMPPRQEQDHPNVVGGYVRDPNRGKHKWVISADVNSMYPLLGMVGFNMSPETFVPKHKLPDGLRDIVLSYFNDQDESKRIQLNEDIWIMTIELLQQHDLCLGINGAVFKKDKVGLIPEMVQNIYDSRKQAKKVMFKYEQQKVLIKDILNGRK